MYIKYQKEFCFLYFYINILIFIKIKSGCYFKNAPKSILILEHFPPLQIFIIKPRVLWSSLVHRHSLQFSIALKNRQLQFQHSMKCKIHLRVESTLHPFLSGFEHFVFYGILVSTKRRLVIMTANENNKAAAAAWNMVFLI